MLYVKDCIDFSGLSGMNREPTGASAKLLLMTEQDWESYIVKEFSGLMIVAWK